MIAVPTGAGAQAWEALTGEDLHRPSTRRCSTSEWRDPEFEPGGRTAYHKPNAIDLQGRGG